MSMLHRIGATVIVAVLGAASSAQASPTPEDLYRTLSPSVWLVRSLDVDGVPIATGSAVVTAPETLVTNCHVLRKAKRITVSNDNVQHGARLQYIDVERDLCQITARNMKAPPVTIGDSEQLRVGQKVYAIGNPMGMERTLSDGLISGLRRSEDQSHLVLIQISAPISHGSSGGGLFDADGRLIGITTLITRDSQNLNFAIPINWLRELPDRSDAALKKGVATVAAAAPAAPAHSTDVNDVEAVPVTPRCRDEYRRFIAAVPPRAFAIADGGKCAWANGRGSPRPDLSTAADPTVRAVDYCTRMYGSGSSCTLYAVDGKVVWGH